MGGSYGGYATLAGLTLTPKTFKCGVDIVGPSSLVTLAESAVDRYITPENLPSFFGYRETYRNQIRPALGLAEPPTMLAGTLFAGTPIDRIASFYARVRRAVFYSLTRFEVEIVDRYQPERRYVSTFELKGLEWKLTALAVLGAGY